MELEVGLTAASIDPILDVNFYTFNAYGGIDGNVLLPKLVTQGNLDYVSTFNQAANDFILSEEVLLLEQELSPLFLEYRIRCNPTITLAIEDQYIERLFMERILQKIGDDFDDRLTLNQSFVKRGSVMIKIYYTQSK